MSVQVESVSAESFYDRRIAISIDGDERQDAVIASVLQDGFALDWQDLIDDVGDSDDPLADLERVIRASFRSAALAETVAALGLNGALIASYANLKHEELAGVRPFASHSFADAAPTPKAAPKLFTPRAALEHWRTILGLTTEQVEQLKSAALTSFKGETFALSNRVTVAILERLADIHRETIGSGMGKPEFLRRALEIMPKASRAVLETEYRTRLTQAYGGARYSQITSRSKTFPFIQYIIIDDGRTTWWICLPMGTSGPGGKGYIAATTDKIWIIWTPPNHYSCRSDLSPIGYLEAIRIGILNTDGRTRVAKIGSNPDRPYGDPPKWAEHPTTGVLRKIEPQLGFGGGDTQAPGTPGDDSLAPERMLVRIIDTGAGGGGVNAGDSVAAPDADAPTLNEMLARLKSAPKEVDGKKLIDRARKTKDWERRRDSGAQPSPPPAQWVVDEVLATLRDLIARGKTVVAGQVDITVLRAAMSGQLPGATFDRALLGMYANRDGIYLDAAPGFADFQPGWIVSTQGTIYWRVGLSPS